MSDSDRLLAAVAAAVVDSDPEDRRLLRSVVDVARSIFGAAASSIFLLDEVSGDLVFEAVSGAGEEFLVGRRFPADQGIAGWVVGCREPLIVEDLSQSAHFARDFARSTGYVPSSLMAAPLLDEDRVVGVLEVLDPTVRVAPLGDIDLLSLFGQQAAIALRVVQRSRTAGVILAQEGADLAELVDLVRAFGGIDSGRREAGLGLLRSVQALLSAAP
ncbi:GAF domain-containing protein [Spongiactinospora sp. TRM90649]|uniref:GAF domain-containing protein n=1 Tax=Spongiactinospora sp. TRM90649 TaxID=3031114 RepID=UPI0023F6AE2C|nr:GAF domain-containing protein [Spongiactinospora sp. TRM90649]MDF5759106.1 GAF domain-containing protein [Spongiactinospora sp. TRM90649]